VIFSKSNLTNLQKSLFREGSLTNISEQNQQLHTDLNEIVCGKHFSRYLKEDQENTFTAPLFKKVKDNLPSTAPPKPLEYALTGIRTELLSAKLNHVHDNISSPEKEAIKNLVELRKQGSIVNKPLGKTGGLAVFDREDYVKGMEKVLSEKYIKPDGEEIYYYQTVTQNALSYILANLKEIIKGEKGIFETGGSRSYDTIKI
jgi:hypothetical protein